MKLEQKAIPLVPEVFLQILINITILCFNFQVLEFEAGLWYLISIFSRINHQKFSELDTNIFSYSLGDQKLEISQRLKPGHQQNLFLGL